MNSDSARDLGQVSLLVISLSIAFLSAMTLIGDVAGNLIQQQRLKNLADSAALAGAQELEFNAGLACSTAESLVIVTQDVQFYCEVSDSSINLELRQPSKSSLVRFFNSTLTATAKAGLAR